MMSLLPKTYVLNGIIETVRGCMQPATNPFHRHKRDIMASLALPSLEVQNFRGFQDLRIEKLGRVNLIVGKNNIGKSSLLEAIQLYATKADPAFLQQILAVRYEDRGRQRIEKALSSVKYLFFGRKDITGPTDPIKISPVDDPEQQVQISLEFYRSKLDEEGRITFQILPPAEYNTAEDPIPRFSVFLWKTFNTSYSLDTVMRPRLFRTDAKGINVISIEANGLGNREIAQLWDKITLTNHEQEVLKALRIVAPGIEAINLVDQSARCERTPIVKAQG